MAPRLGVSRDGQPLSLNRLPAPDLAPWIGWLYATSVEAPPDYELNCSLLSDTAMIRIQLEGNWSAQTRDGHISGTTGALYFGPQSKAMPITVRGSFTSVGIALKPGTGHSVTGLPAADFVDRIVPCEEVGLPVGAALGALDPTGAPEDWLKALETIARAFLCGAKAKEPNAISARLEWLALTDPSASVADFAEENGISLRQLERNCRRDFGVTPKQVLRRARALDMASSLRGVSDMAEEDEMILRYYDQSHMTHEFSRLFGMTPRQFVETPQPLMTLALESRQSRRLALLERLTPGKPRPWQKAD
ncbi:helix-turn-helix transcriptional regulator [Alteraurantiacibacter aquimixticola]|uniref:helix-turn-helix transcriptional regulator n=1 Tax=Alteraurantiacibacter aquimixticola TaxID=2489173 RepID=UPI001FEAF4D5|nr:helix-turn-helix transcriptional regulator [Alteraurantiacibacter aquimixticola]